MAVLEAERRSVMALRDGARIGNSLAERLVTDIDADRLRVQGDVGRLTSAEDV